MRSPGEDLSLKAAAAALRLFRFPLKRYRYRFYLKVKNSGLVMRGRLRHSGVSLPLDLGDWVQYWMFMDGAYERDLVDFLRPRVRGGTFFDIGANVGNYTLTLARDAKKIISFEASPSNARILGRFVEQAGLSNVELVNRAVSGRSGEKISIFISPDATGNFSRFLDYGGGSEDVETVRLDDFVKERNIDRVDAMKIDIEGGEFDAVRGAEGLIGKWRPILLVEFNSAMAAMAGWKPKDLFDRIVSYGYKAHELKKRKLTVYDRAKLGEQGASPNLIFLPV